MATRAKRLVLHGEHNVVRWEIEDGELHIETFDCSSGSNEHTSLAFDRSEMRDMHAFLGRALKPLRRAPRVSVIEPDGTLRELRQPLRRAPRTKKGR